MNSSAWWLLPRINFDENTSSPSGGPPSGGTASPDSSPPPPGGAEPPAPAPAPSSPEGGDPFAGMDDDLDSIDLGAAPTGDEPGGPVPSPAPVAPVAPTPAPVTPPQVQGQPPAPPQTAAGNVQTGAAGPPSGAAGSQLDWAIDGFKTNHKELSEWASQNLFALSKEEQEALESDAVAMIPKLMGRVYTNAIQATTHLIKNFVPDMVNSGVMSQQQRTARATEALSEFYAANPHLNAQQHAASVDKWARAFRAANPQASRKDAIAFVGRAVSAEHGLAPGPNGTQRAQPFTPARPGGRAPPAPQGTDPYAGMEDEYD